MRIKNYGSDYSISFDAHSDTNYRLPLWQLYLILRPELKDKLFNRSKHTSFEKFCSFTVSNPNNIMRNSFLQQVSSYKRVSSYGQFMTNDFSLIAATKGRYWRDAKYDFFNKHTHKFSIAYENTSYPYYCTEKLMDGFLAGSIPLYWGDPKIGEDWNQAAFLNVQRLGADIINIILTLDNDKSKFEDWYHEPVFTDSQKDKLVNNLGEFETWLLKIVK